MTAPTPASALNACRFCEWFWNFIGIVRNIAICFQHIKHPIYHWRTYRYYCTVHEILQVNVKQKLACSTIAQMGFMIMQCGLGFFNAAVAHLILHGFYKAYLFLSSGEEIAQTKPQKPIQLKIKPLQALWY